MKKRHVPDDLLKRALRFYRDYDCIDLVEKYDIIGRPLEIVIPYGLNDAGPCAYRIIRKGEKYEVKYLAASIEESSTIEECITNHKDQATLSILFEKIDKIKKFREKNKNKSEPVMVVT